MRDRIRADGLEAVRKADTIMHERISISENDIELARNLINPRVLHPKGSKPSNVSKTTRNPDSKKP